MVGLFSPTENPLVQLAFSGALRLCPGSNSRKDPLPVEVIKSVVDTYKLRPHNLLECRTILVILLGFCGFFRISELLSVRIQDVTFLPDHIEIFLESSKCDQYRQGNTVIVSKTRTEDCPVTFLEKFMADAELTVDDKEAYVIPMKPFKSDCPSIHQ